MFAQLYRLILKRTSTFAVVTVGAAYFFERSFDMVADSTFERINRGKLWNDIKHKYE